MKKYILGLFIALLVPATFALASSPALTLSGSGDGSNVTVSVTGADGNSAVSLYFNEVTGGVLHMQALGNTDATGAFSTSVNTNTLDINNTTPVHLVINGYQTNSLMWPYNRTNMTQQITFSQNNSIVNIGQTGNVTVTGGNGTYYISSNSNSSVANASISGSTLYFSGIANGSTIIRVCSVTENSCGTTTISTNNSNNGGLQRRKEGR